MSLAIEAAKLAASTGLGLVTANWQDKRQIKQQQKLQDQQIQGQKEMSRYNQEMGLKMWEATNYAAQRRQMEQAGLNVGLMYGMGGGGGATAQVAPGNVSGADAPKGGNEMGMAMQLGLNAAMQKAQIELTKAQTEKTKVETEKTGGVDTASTAQVTATAATQQEVLKLEQQLKQIAISVQTQTIDETVRQIQAQVNKTEGEAETAKNAGTMSTETYEQVKKQIQQTTVEQAGRIALQKVNMQATETQMMKATNEIWQIYNTATNENRKITIQEQQLMIQKIMTEFNTNDTQKAKQYVDIWKTIIDGVSGAIKALK